LPKKSTKTGKINIRNYGIFFAAKLFQVQFKPYIIQVAEVQNYKDLERPIHICSYKYNNN